MFPSVRHLIATLRLTDILTSTVKCLSHGLLLQHLFQLRGANANVSSFSINYISQTIDHLTVISHLYQLQVCTVNCSPICINCMSTIQGLVESLHQLHYSALESIQTNGQSHCAIYVVELEYSFHVVLLSCYYLRQYLNVLFTLA